MPTELPQLRSQDQRRLQSYFDARCDIFLMAQKENLAVLDLIRWSQLPAIQSHIAALKQLTDDSIHLRTAQARLLSLDTLEKIVKTTDDPVELRRAATTLYRGGHSMPQPRAPKKPDPDNPPPRYILAKDRDWCSRGPGFHAAYTPPRPTAHDSFSPHPPPPREVPRSSAASGAPSLRSLPTLRQPKSSPARQSPNRSRPP